MQIDTLRKKSHLHNMNQSLPWNWIKVTMIMPMGLGVGNVEDCKPISPFTYNKRYVIVVHINFFWYHQLKKTLPLATRSF
jgi:hypothetical protein